MSERIHTARLYVVYDGGSVGPRLLNSYPASLGAADPGTLTDNLGYYNRKCGSYAALTAQAAGLAVPPFSVLGEPGEWPQTVDSSCFIPLADAQPGDIAVRPAVQPGDPGHAMVILDPDYLGTGNLLASMYNASGTGNFTIELWAPSGQFEGVGFDLVIIRFPAADG
jgi:hypothetical protein